MQPVGPGPMRLILVVLALAAIATFCCWPNTRVAAPVAPIPPTAPTPAEAPLPEVAALTPVEPPRPNQPTLRMPDGSQVPLLNGVLHAAEPAWEPGRPYSPILGKQTVNGIEYYVHADGTTTTTIMAWRTDLKRLDGTTRVAHPKDAHAVVDDQGQPIRRN